MREILLGLLLFINYSVVIGQQSDSFDIPDRKINFGFIIGANKEIKSGHWGFSFGASMDCRITRIIFLQPQLFSTFFDYKKDGITIETVALEAPLHLLIKPINTKLKPTVSFGPNYKSDLISNSTGWYSDIAIGIEKRLKYSTIAPQLRYSYGKAMQTFYFIITFK